MYHTHGTSFCAIAILYATILELLPVSHRIISMTSYTTYNYYLDGLILGNQGKGLRDTDDYRDQNCSKS